MSTTGAAPNRETLLSDREISECLGEFWANQTHEKQLSGAARRIFNATQQWPWQLAAGFSPKVWDVFTLKELAQTIDSLVKESTETNRHVEIHNLVEFLREQARLFPQSNPELRMADVLEAKRHFGAQTRDRRTRENDKKQGEGQTTSGPGAFASSVTTGTRKRTHESPGDSQANKSARRNVPGNPGGLAFGSLAKTVTPAEGLIDLIERVQGEALIPSSMSNMIGTVENLKVESQTYVDESTRELHKARLLMNCHEALLQKVLTNGDNQRKLEELRRACDQRVEAKETIQKAKALFEQHQGEMALDAVLVSQASQQYDRKLRECEEGIALAEAELHDLNKVLTSAIQQGDKRQGRLEEVQAKVTRLETRQAQLALEFEYYRTIGRLMKLGPHGLASLTERLAESGISLLTATKEPEVENEPLINPPS